VYYRAISPALKSAMTDRPTDAAWHADVRAALAHADLIEPPDWVRERARRLFRARTSTPTVSATLLARVRASLLFDSRTPGLAAAGVRSMGVLDGPWQLLYRGGDVDVDLLVRPNQDGRTMSVRGQALSLLGEFVGMGTVEATPTDIPRPVHGPVEPSARTELDPSGEFALSNLERGRYDVLLRFGVREIELSGVEL
jgi:hypothetical protein